MVPATTLRDVERERQVNRALAHLLDEAFRVPGTSMRLGIEPLLGLVPVLGDYAGVILGAVLVLRAVHQGASWPVVARMAVNLGAEAGIGVVPVIGDAFCFAFKANTRNLALLEADLVDPLLARRRSRVALIGVVAGAVTALLTIAFLSFVALVLLLRWLL